MIVRVNNKDITQSNAQAILYCDVRDFQQAQINSFAKAFPATEQERLSLFKMVSNDGNRVWTPGKIKMSSYGGKIKIIHACIADKSDGNAEYTDIRRILEKVRDNYEKLEISNIAMPLIGTGGGLIHDVIETFLEIYFDETPDVHTDKSLTVQLYKY